MADLPIGQAPQPVLLYDAVGNVIGSIGNPLNVNLSGGTSIQSAQAYSNYQPAPGNIPVGVAFLAVDASGRQEAHSAVYSDEGSFRDDFPGTSLTTAITGNITFTNGGTTITGAGFSTQLANGLFVKKAADAETLYVQISSVDSDTSATLASAYGGTSAAAAAVSSRWATTTPTGGSITVASSVCTIASGTTSGQRGAIVAYGDYLPYTLNVYASISQRIANQTAVLGFVDNAASPTKQAVVEFTGTVNTQVNFLTASSAAAADIQRTTVTIPNGGTTATQHQYKIDLSANTASLTIDGVLVATQQLHIPGPYDVLDIVGQISNAAAVTSTNLAVDLFYFSNWDRIQIDDDFSGEPLVVAGMIPGGQADMGAPVKTGAVYNPTLPTYVAGSRTDTQADAAGRTLVLSSPTDGVAATYSAVSAIAFASAAAATDIFTITGSASKTIKVLRLAFSATQTTASAVNVLAVKRSTANTGGTSAAATAVPHDSTDAAATATVLNYTANPTLGSAVGTLRAVRAFIPSSLLAAASQYYEFDFGNLPDKAIFLRGTTQVLALNLNGVTVAGGTWTCFVEWLEL